jgi:hypothetical protein
VQSTENMAKKAKAKKAGPPAKQPTNPATSSIPRLGGEAVGTLRQSTFPRKSKNVEGKSGKSGGGKVHTHTISRARVGKGGRKPLEYEISAGVSAT